MRLKDERLASGHWQMSSGKLCVCLKDVTSQRHLLLEGVSQEDELMPQTRPRESRCLTSNCLKRYLLRLGAGGRQLLREWLKVRGVCYLILYKHVCCCSATIWLRAVTKKARFTRGNRNLCVVHAADSPNTGLYSNTQTTNHLFNRANSRFANSFLTTAAIFPDYLINVQRLGFHTSLGQRTSWLWIPAAPVHVSQSCF